jgi:hypothetical protein
MTFTVPPGAQLEACRFCGAVFHGFLAAGAHEDACPKRTRGAR